MKITPNRFAWIFLVALVAVLMTVGYYVYQFFKDPATTFITVEREQQLGDMIAEQTVGASSDYLLVKNDYADSCLKQIMTRLKDGIGGTAYSYRVEIVDRIEPNAFAIPGGRIFVHTGLIQFCNTPEELACIMAHEMGHIEKRHTVNNIMKRFGTDIVIGYISGDNSGATSEITGELINHFFSREDEAEADDFALDLLAKAGIRPGILGEVFERLKKEYGDMEGVMNLLSTHPELDQRSEKAGKFKVAESFAERPIDMDWSRLQNQLRSKP